MLNPTPREIYYSGDVSKRPMAGDEYVQLDWDESSPRKQKRLRFPTLKELNQALEKQEKRH